MDCKSVMAPIRVSIHTDQSAGTVIDFMVEKHMGLVPVTERDGTFAGLVSGEGLIAHMLPRAIGHVTAHHRRAGLRSTSFFDESAEDMHERLQHLRERPIGELVERDCRTVSPETPLIDALMLIKARQYVVPVVDGEKKLLGAISFFSVLYGLDEEYSREKSEMLKTLERQNRELEKAANKDQGGGS